MGRVSKHKKIKACDPFYKGPRRDQHRLDNLPPGSLEDDQPVPKSLTRILQSSQQYHKSESTKPSHPVRTKSTPSGDLPEVAGTSKDEPVFKRKRGESLNDYLVRIDVEGRARLVESFKGSRKMSERRKKYYEKRRKRLLSKKGRKIQEEDVVEFNDLKDDVHFREVASAPPRLSAKPRGSEKILVKSKLLSKDSDDQDEPSKISKPTKVKVGLKRRQDIEEERERMIQEYRRTKKAKLSRTKPESRELIL